MQMTENFVTIIAENVTNTNASVKKFPVRTHFSVQVVGATTAGAGSAVVQVEVSNVLNPTLDGHWSVAGIITLTLSSTLTSDALAIIVPYKHVRVRATSISGTGANYSAYLCAG